MNQSNQTRCSHCGVSLNDTDDQPCYHCGKKGKSIFVTVHDGITIRDNLVINSTSGKTNRSTIHVDTRNPTDTVKIQKLIIDFVENGVDGITPYIDLLVKDFDNKLSGKTLPFFRAVDISVKKHLSGEIIGPSPNANDGRYNVKGERCIYLIDDQDFLYAELNSSSILIQRFNVPVDSFKIADISSHNNNVHNSLALAFDMTENGRTSSGYNFEAELEKRGKSKYLVSQILSDSFKRNGWDGIYIPGVHGSQVRHYHNCTIFSTVVDQWVDWTNGSYFSSKNKMIISK